MQDFDKALEASEAEREIARLQRINDDLRRSNNSLRKTDDQIRADLADLRRELALYRKLDSATPRPPKWTVRTSKARKHVAIACGMFSDWHMDEVVRPEEVGGINAYDRDIAIRRLRAWAENFVKITHHYTSGLDHEGAVLLSGGDHFGGLIHAELRETNNDTLFGSILFWSEQIASAFLYIADHFPKLHVAWVVGNHGRLTMKPRAKFRARDNADWMLAHMVRRVTEPRITHTIPESADCIVPVYNTVHLLTHGDQVSGGAGIGGIWPPIKRLQARKQIASPHDVICMGHWHQLVAAPSAGIIVNGSGKGYDEYAYTSAFEPEPPQQALWLVTPERGAAATWAVACD